jgi:hypothetical protein
VKACFIYVFRNGRQGTKCLILEIASNPMLG